MRHDRRDDRCVPLSSPKALLTEIRHRLRLVLGRNNRQPYQQLVDRTVQGLGDPFIEGEVLQFRQLTQELLEARQEVVDASAKVRHAQCIEMLATSALAAA